MRVFLRFVFGLVLVILLALAVGYFLIPHTKIVTDTVTGQSVENDKKSITFFATQAVYVIKTDGMNSLVKQCNYPEESMWVPSRLLIEMSAFTPLSAWHGEEQYEVVAGDYYAKYFFKPDGTFKLEISEMNEDKSGASVYEMATYYGRLYKAENVIWARFKDVTPELFRYESIHMFWVKPDGKLSSPSIEQA